MKIARNVVVFERLDEWCSRPPGSLSEGAGMWAVPFIGVLAKIQRYGRFSSPLRSSEDLTFCYSSDDTPSVTPVGRASSLREGAGMWAVPFIGVLAKIQRYGRFSSPLRNSEDFGVYHSTCRSEIGRLRAIFIAPTKALVILPFTIHRRALPQRWWGFWGSWLRIMFTA